jgi:hypothetical protein
MGALVHSVDRVELLEALRRATGLLVSEGTMASVCTAQLTARLSEFIAID